MATKRNTRKKKEFVKIDVGEGFTLHYMENEYGLFAIEHNGAIIYGCKLYEGDNGLFVSYPSRKGNDGKYYSHARFIEHVPDTVLEKIADAIGF